MREGFIQWRHSRAIGRHCSYYNIAKVWGESLSKEEVHVESFALEEGS